MRLRRIVYELFKWYGAEQLLSSNRAAKLHDASFISYRRDDTEGHVLALVRPLRDRLGEDRIFKDTDGIPAGKDFVEALQRELASCSVVLVVIGRNWLNIQDPRLRSRRLDSPGDFVRIEVATALQNNRILVVPVLVAGAAIPAEDDLPLDLRPLSRRQALPLTSTHWDDDVRRLLDVIEAACGDTPKRTWPSALTRGLSAAAVVTLTALVMFWAGGRSSDRSPSTDPGPAQQQPSAGATSTTQPPVVKPSEGSIETSTEADGPSSAKPDAPTPPTPTRRPPPEGALPSLRDAEATAIRAWQRARAEGVSEEALNSGRRKQREGERLRDAGRTDSAIQSFRAAAADFDAATDAAATATAVPPKPPITTSEPTAPPDGTKEPATAVLTKPPVPAPEAIVLPDGTKEAEAAVRQALERFRVAYAGKNETALRSVFPKVRADRLFGNLEVCARVSLAFGDMTVRVFSATEAQVDVQTTYGCQPRTAQKEQVSGPVSDTFRLERHGAEWVIDRRQITLDER